MPITGTGTGPFTITGTETSAAIFSFVTTANAGNAAKLAGAQYRWNCVLNIGGLWNPIEEQHEFNATFTVQNTGVFRAGEFDSVTGLVRRGCFIRHNGNGPQIQSGGTYELNASVGFANNAGNNNVGGRFVVRDSACNFRDSMNAGGANLYRRVSIGHNGAVGFKYNAIPEVFSDVKISGVTFGIQPQTGAAGVFTDTVFDNCVWDTVPNVLVENLTFLGLYDGTGNPKNTLKIGAERNGGVERISWRYDFSLSLGGSGYEAANVRIKDVTGAVVVSTTTNSTGAISQVNLERVVYTGLVSRSPGQAFSGTTTNKFPHTVQVRDYSIQEVKIIKQADRHSSDSALAIQVQYLTLTKAQALALTGIAFAPSGATGGTVAISGARTIAELWQYYRAWISQTANFDREDTWTYDGTTLNIGAWTISGIENLSTGAITTSTATAGGAFSIAVNGTVNQATPTNLLATAKATTLVYNTNTDISVTYATGTQIGTVRNDGTGIVTISGGSITDYTDTQINYLDSNITAVGIDSATIYQTQSDRDTGANAGATFTNSLNFKYGSVVNGVTMQNTVYLRVVVGSVTLFAQMALAIGSNTLDLGVQGQLSAIGAKVDLNAKQESLVKMNDGLKKIAQFKPYKTDL